MNQQQLQHLSDVIEKEITKDALKGASILIRQDGKQICKKHLGTDRENMIYRIFSMTKPITCVAAYILYERGQLDLLAPVREYLPYFKDMRVIDKNGMTRQTESEITVSQLLNMTSGIVYPGEDSLGEIALYKKMKEMTHNGTQVTADIIGRSIAASPLEFQPGEKWHYGMSADVLGLIIEAVSGMKLGVFMKKEIFEPLHMEDTDFFVKKEKKDRLAPIYMHDKNNRLVPVTTERAREVFCIFDIGIIDNTVRPEFEAGGSGLYSTILDYSKFMEMLLNRGSVQGVRILGEKTVDFITLNQLSREQLEEGDYPWKGYGYGNLMRVMTDTTQGVTNGSIGEYGWDGLAGNYMMVDPKEKLIFIYMQQIVEGADVFLRRKMRQIIYSAL